MRIAVLGDVAGDLWGGAGRPGSAAPWRGGQHVGLQAQLGDGEEPMAEVTARGDRGRGGTVDLCVEGGEIVVSQCGEGLAGG